MASAQVAVCFSCCVVSQPPQKKPQIDRSMIGLPMDFRHTGHIGSGDVRDTSKSSSLSTMQTQMSSKGGYDKVSPVNIQLNLIDVPNKSS